MRSNSQESDVAQTELKKQVKLSYEDYRTLSNLLIHYLRKKEAEIESEDDEGTVKRSDVVNWYLEEISNDIENQEELLEKKYIVEKVIDRLTYQDQILIPLSKTGLSAKGDVADDDSANDPILVVHPNYHDIQI